MASGLPDYMTGVNVVLQTMAEMTTRPKYGAALLETGSEAVMANIVNPLAGISGKGMLYGANIWLDYTSSQSNSILLLLLDGTILNDISMIRLKDYGIAKPRSSIVTINKYDSVNHIYSLGLSYGLTFESIFAILYDEKHGGTPTIHYRLVYALI